MNLDFYVVALPDTSAQKLSSYAGHAILLPELGRLPPQATIVDIDDRFRSEPYTKPATEEFSLAMVLVPIQETAGVTKRNKVRISPPIPLRPESLHCQRRPSPSDTQLLHHEPGGFWKDEQPSELRPVPPPKSQIKPHTTQQWADLDPDKREPGFARIHPDGWSKVIPKQWMEDQLSDRSSDTGVDDDRSVYSQSSGDEVTKCLPVCDPSATENGEEPASLLRRIEDIALPAVAALRDQSCVDNSKEPQDLHAWWDGGSKVGSASSDPIRYWMSSLQPLPDPHVCSDNDEENDQASSSLCESRRQNKPPRQVFTDPLSSDRALPSGLKTATGMETGHLHDGNLLVPRPLRLSQRGRGTSPATTAAVVNNEYETSGTGRNYNLLSILNKQHPEAKSLQSSWSTIYCSGAGVAGGDDNPTACAPPRGSRIAHAPLTEPLTTNFKDKALPPLPPGSDSICSNQYRNHPPSSPERRIGRGQRGRETERDRLTADIDEILDMYLPVHPGSGHPIYSSTPAPDRADVVREDKAKAGRTDRSRSKPKPAQCTRPPKRSMWSFDTDPELGVNHQANARGMPQPTRATMTATSTTSPSASFVAVYPCAFDPERYPELRHGREGRTAPLSKPPPAAAAAAAATERMARGRPKAMMASVDKDGQIWI
ncbi:hypothetical protein CLAIMM_03551 [Cladophialophora immunda]|nr:hypothetical protein CLAIMM_03551 [Cladophialophora immunda]